MEKIKCPECNHEFSVDEFFQHENEKRIQKELEASKEKMAEEWANKAKEIEKKAQKDQEEQLKAKEKLVKAEKENEMLALQNKHNLEKEDLILQSQEKEKQMRRKFEEVTSGISSSGQLRGEVGEHYVKEKLEYYFKDDVLREVPRGKEGVDWILDINAKRGKPIASIYIEVKRTKTYLKSWVKKLRKDMQNDGIDYGFLLTKTFPAEHKGRTQFLPPGSRGEITVCSLDERDFFVPIALIRNQLIRLNTMINIDKASRSEIPQKMFEYVTSNEYKNHHDNILRAIAERREAIVKRKKKFDTYIREDQALLETIETALIQARGGILLISGEEDDDE